MRYWKHLLPFVLLASVAQAEQAPIILECTMDDSSSYIYKITPQLWSFWDSEKWRWAETDCALPGYTNEGETRSVTDRTIYTNNTVKCERTNTDEKIGFTISGVKEINYERIQAGFSDHFKLMRSIDRISGAITFYKSHTLDGWGNFKTRPEEQSFQSGTCAKATDPALKPRPAPPPPPVPKF